MIRPNTLWIAALAIATALTGTGCAKLSPPGLARDEPRAEHPTAEPWGRFTEEKTSAGNKSIFFNEQSHDIEKSLGF